MLAAQILVCQDVASSPRQEKWHETTRPGFCAQVQFVAKRREIAVLWLKSCEVTCNDDNHWKQDLHPIDWNKVKPWHVSNHGCRPEFDSFRVLSTRMLKLRQRQLSILAANRKCSNQQLQTQWQKLWPPVLSAVNSWSRSLHLTQNALASPDRTLSQARPSQLGPLHAICGIARCLCLKWIPPSTLQRWHHGFKIKAQAQKKKKKNWWRNVCFTAWKYRTHQCYVLNVQTVFQWSLEKQSTANLFHVIWYKKMRKIQFKIIID